MKILVEKVSNNLICLPISPDGIIKIVPYKFFIVIVMLYDKNKKDTKSV